MRFEAYFSCLSRKFTSHLKTSVESERDFERHVTQLFCSCQYQWLKSKPTIFEEESHSGRLPPCLRTLLLWSRPHRRHLAPYLLLLIHLFPGNQCFPHLLVIFSSSAPQLFHHPQWQHHRETSQRRGRHCRQHLQQGRSTEDSQREKLEFQEK